MTVLLLLLTLCLTTVYLHTTTAKTTSFSQNKLPWVEPFKQCVALIKLIDEAKDSEHYLEKFFGITFTEEQKSATSDKERTSGRQEKHWTELLAHCMRLTKILSEKKPEDIDTYLDSLLRSSDRLRCAKLGWRTKKTFTASKEKKPWLGAKADCEKRGLQLATAESTEELEQLKTYIHNTGQKHGYWVGLSDLGQKGRYEWAHSGQPTSFTAWAPEEPSHRVVAGETEHCVEIVMIEGSGSYHGKWNDRVCSEPTYYVCENQN